MAVTSAERAAGQKYDVSALVIEGLLGRGVVGALSPACVRLEIGVLDNVKTSHDARA